MKTVVLEVRSLAETLTNVARTMKTGRAARVAHIGFATPELLWQVLTAKRWELLKALLSCAPTPVQTEASHFAVANGRSPLRSG